MSFTNVLKYGLVSQGGLNPVWTGLQNYYRFEDNLVDSIGTYNGTGTSVSYVTGKNNKALYCNNGYSTIANNGQGNFNIQTFSIACWVKVTFVAGNYRIIWSYDYTSHAGPLYAQHLRIERGTGQVMFGWNVGGTYKQFFTDLPYYLSDGVFGHIVVTHESGVAVKLYVNGSLAKTDTTNVGTITYYNQEVWIGRSNWMTDLLTTIDEVGFWNRALSQAEVTTLYNAGAGIYY